MSRASRLNKFLALHLGISRRAADELIAAGKIKIDGSRAQLGQQVRLDQKITVNDINLAIGTNLAYVALNKPVGYVCSRRAQGESATVYSLLPARLHNLKLVGRLDKDSSGLLMLTNDGDFAHQMTHPKFRKSKIYEIEINKALSKENFHKITQIGVDMGDKTLSKFQLVASLQSPVFNKNTIHTNEWRQGTRDWRATLAEGRNRQIRRTFEAMGYQVLKLHRTDFGDLTLSKLKLASGQWRQISPP